MSKIQAKARIAKLRDLINEYRFAYHVHNQSIMSESAADSLKHELAELEAKYPDLITMDSPTQRVAGQALPGFSQVRHATRMVSLNDVFSKDELQAWVVRIQKLAPEHEFDFFVDMKLDGLACALVYQDGIFTQAVTRGDGFVGEDVTANVRTIESVPYKLRASKEYAHFLKGRTEIRGEIVIFKQDFDLLNKQRQKANKPIFANPRNLAAGSIRQLDPALASARPLRFRAWDILRDNPTDIPTYKIAYEALQALGVPAGNQSRVLKNVASIMQYATEWEQKRQTLSFNTDGLVVRVNNREIYSRLGMVGKAPRAAVAYKYAAEEATTVVKDIVISIGRTGAATPVAVCDPVQVAGTTVRHASLHNAHEIARKDIRVGDTVIIFKAGDIIPQVSRVLTKLRPANTKPFNMQQELARQYPELTFVRPDGEAVYRVKGATSKILLKQALAHYASKAALDIDGLGDKNVAALVDARLVGDLADIYTLTQDQVIELERFAELSARNLIQAIAAAKNPELPRFIFGLGIRHVGQQTAIDLAEHFTSVDGLQQATLDSLLAIEGVGTVVAESIVAWFADPDNQLLLKKFADVGVVPVYQSHAQGPLHGKSFVITGTLSDIDRDKAADKIRSLGGTFQTAVGKSTTYLVVGESPGASKVQKAKKLGTAIINEQDLDKMLKL